MIQYENVKYFIDTHEEPGTLMACYLVHIKVKSRKYQGVERKKERKKGKRVSIELACWYPRQSTEINGRG